MSNSIPSTDHLGKEYPSVEAMCRAYPVKSGETFRHRIADGMSLEDALTKPIGLNKRKCVDHLGNEYPTKKSMCEHYHIEPGVLNVRLNKLHWDLEKALTTPVHETEWIPVNGPDGKQYQNVAQMCKELGISRSAYDRRKENENQLDDTINMRTKNSCSDGMGNEFTSVSAMCRHYDISRDLYYHRVNNLKMDPATALTMPYEPSIIKATDRIGEKHIANNGVPYTIVDATTDRDITVEFIDGERTKVCYSVNVARGIVKHPTLLKKGSGTFAGFNTKSAFSDESGVYYVCKCQTCGKKDIMTPEQMFQHFKEHN